MIRVGNGQQHCLGFIARFPHRVGRTAHPKGTSIRACVQHEPHHRGTHASSGEGSAYASSVFLSANMRSESMREAIETPVMTSMCDESIPPAHGQPTSTAPLMGCGALGDMGAVSDPCVCSCDTRRGLAVTRSPSYTPLTPERDRRRLGCTCAASFRSRVLLCLSVTCNPNRSEKWSRTSCSVAN